MTRDERIVEARRMIEAGEFDRKIVSSKPEDLDYDRITLECGHNTLAAPSFRALSRDVRKRQSRDPDCETCRDCVDAWIGGDKKQAADEVHRKRMTSIDRNLKAAGKLLRKRK